MFKSNNYFTKYQLLLVTLIAAFSYVSSKEIMTCRSGRFQCANQGACIPHEYVCDGRSDCSDSSDETNCSQGRNCKIKNCTHFCVNSVCNCPMGFILDKDGRTCLDVDECKTETAVCSQNCTNTQGSFICSCFDGFTKNSDGSCKNDVSGETKKPQLVCTSGKHPCDNGESCISMDYVCDGSIDCGDGSDEENCQYGRLCKLKQCEDSCVDSTTRCYNCYNHISTEQKLRDYIKCSCRQGYKLNSNARTCDDIDECALGTHNCTQICTNTVGFYNCSCATGYYFDYSDFVCKAGGKYPLIYIGTPNEIIAHNLIRNRSYSFGLSHDGSVEKIIHNFQNKNVLWLESLPEGGQIIESNQDGSNRKLVSLDYAFFNPVGLDIDWYNDLIYVSDAGSGEIVACRRSSGLCVVVTKGEMSRPISVILDPSRRKMFYLDKGVSPGIYCSGMDGSNTTRLITSPKITSIALDKATNTLVYSFREGNFQKIDALSISSGRNWTILSNQTYPVINSPITNVEVFEDTIYFSTLSNVPKIWSFPGPRVIKKNVSPKVELSLHPENTILSLSIAHESLDTHDNISNPCDSSKCVDFCLLSPNGGFQCKTSLRNVAEEFSNKKNDTEDLATSDQKIVSKLS